MPNAALILAARVLLALIFVLSGFSKLADPAGTAGYFEAVGLPLPYVTAWAVGILELVGGILIVAGFWTRITAAVLALFCVASALVAHFDPADQMQMIMFMKNLAIAGGFLVLAAAGAGKWSVEGRAV